MEGISAVLFFSVLFFFIYSVIRMSIQHSERKLSIRHGAAAATPDPGVAAAHIEIAALKERVQVLEKLVTDDDRRLADEIDRLRRADARS